LGGQKTESQATILRKGANTDTEVRISNVRGAKKNGKEPRKKELKGSYSD